MLWWWVGLRRVWMRYENENKGGLERGKIAQKRTGLKKVNLKGLSHFVGVGKGNFWERGS